MTISVAGLSFGTYLLVRSITSPPTYRPDIRLAFVLRLILYLFFTYFVIGRFVFFLVVKKIFDESKEFFPKSFNCAKPAGKVSCRHFRSRIDSGILKDTNITLKVRVKQWQFGHRNIKYGDVFHKIVVFVREFLTGEHHVIQGRSKLPGNCVSSFFPFAGLQIKVVAPFAKHFRMAADEAVGA